MEFEEINEESKVYPGEYLLHEPSREIVLCGAYIKNEGKIRAMRHGRLMEDRVENFKKIYMSSDERKERRSNRCKGCSSK